MKIRIGGELDGTLARSLATATSQIQRAEKQIQREKKATTSAADQEARKQLKAQEALTKATESLDRQRARGLFQQYKAQEAAADRAAKAEIRARQRVEAAAQRSLDKTMRAMVAALEKEERARERAYARTGRQFAERTSHRATRFLMPNAPIGSLVSRGIGDVAQGAGVDFSIQGAVSRVVDLQRAAVDLSNSGYQAGAEGPNGKRVGAKALIEQARAVGGQFGIDANEVMQGLAQYQKIAGDLNTGRQTLVQMAALSKATGTNLADMAAATANVSNGLGDIPNKAAIIDEVMRTIAGQGKLGAVEISDMATQMARIAAAASGFGGDRATNIKEFGALAQIARAEGGAPSAAEAARSMGGFANTFKKGARDKEFNKIVGKSAYTDGSHTTLRDPIELIKDALTATKGDQLKMNKIFMDVVGARTVTGLSKAYNGAGGGDAGLKKVDDLIQRMMKAQISEQEVRESAAEAAATTAAKAARFQNEWDKVTESVMADLVPALEKSGDSILKFANVVGNIATWAVNNPKAAIAAAITASIARAGVESAMRAGIERLIVGGDGSRAGTVGKLVSGAGMLGTIASLGITTLMVGELYAEQLYDESEKEFSSGIDKANRADDLQKKIEDALAKGDLGTAKKLTEKQMKLRGDAADDITNSATHTGFAGAWDTVARDMQMWVPGGQDALKKSDEATMALWREQIEGEKRSQALLARIAESIEGAAMPPGDNSGTGTRVPQ